MTEVMNSFEMYCEAKDQIDQVFHTKADASKLLRDMAEQVFARVDGLHKFVVKVYGTDTVLYDPYGHAVSVQDKPHVEVLYGGYSYVRSWDQTSYVVVSDYENDGIDSDSEKMEDFFELRQVKVGQYVKGEHIGEIDYANTGVDRENVQQAFRWVKSFCENISGLRYAAFNKDNSQDILETFQKK